ncbi:MAG TPA: Gfo/Idh/MocA family oxidoreductase [Oscillospiraceae bacterium]|nr:Gfo/Idh/MocA family oxidoreductase [Oscillospiraceae bacterium]
MGKLKVAIIGTGGISNEHINGYLSDKNVELYAFCDINEAQLKKMAEKYNMPWERCFLDKDEMLKALPEIQAVSVCTWNSAHAECTIAALNAGKHVICEKPMAMNAKEATAMWEAAEKAKKLLMIGFVRRYGNDAAVVKDFIDNDYFGDIYYAKATYLRRNGNPGGWFGDKSRSGGGPLIDLGVHVIDLVKYLTGNPKPISVYASTYQKLFNRPEIKSVKGYVSVSAGSDDICDVEDLAVAMIRFDNGLTLSVETSFSLNIKEDKGDIELFGTKAGCKLDPDVEIYTDINNYMVDLNFTRQTRLDFEGLFKNQIDHFIDCVMNGAKPIAPAKDGVEMMKILDAIYESAKTGHEVII